MVRIGGPATYTYVIPEIDFEIPELDGNAIAFGFPDVKVFTDVNEEMIRAYSGMQLSKEEIVQARKEMEEARAQMKVLRPQVEMIRNDFDAPEFRKVWKEMEMVEMRKELEKARAEMVKARKELEEARKEFKKKSE